MSSNSKKSVDAVLDCVKEESKAFFEDMLMDVLEIEDIQDSILYDYSSLVFLTGVKKFTIIISIDDELLKTLFDKFFQNNIDDDKEKNELMNDMPNEVINMIAGLSIRNFPSEYKELKLSIPVKLSKVNMLKILDKNISKSIKVVSEGGNLICAVACSSKV